MDRARLGQLQHCVLALLRHLNTLGRDNVADILYLLEPKATLRLLYTNVELTEPLQNHLRAGLDLLGRAPKDNHVIYIANTDFVYQAGQHLVHHRALEIRRCLLQTEWHPLKFERSRRGKKSRQVGRVRMNRALVITRSKVQYREVLGALQRIED